MSDLVSAELVDAAEHATLRCMYERADLQRLLRQDPTALGEDLLVTAEEFGGWEDSRRRIDLLALGRTGHLVAGRATREVIRSADVLLLCLSRRNRMPMSIYLLIGSENDELLAGLLGVMRRGGSDVEILTGVFAQSARLAWEFDSSQSRTRLVLADDRRLSADDIEGVVVRRGGGVERNGWTAENYLFAAALAASPTSTRWFSR